jgi:reactive intermediate/imine deaminase
MTNLSNLVFLLAAAMSLNAAPIQARALADTIAFVPAKGAAPFSAAVRVGDILYLSGQIGSGPDGKLAEGWEAQSVQTLDNIAAVLKSQGLGMDDVFKCTVMLSDMSKWSDFNKIYVRYFKPGRLPARSAMGVNGLAANAFVELECWAHVGGVEP